ncbi:hypothetical protein SAMN05421781_0300 [Marinococcus luteus]|uniref:Uncharacterized protein n=1 Tax=Marinococcus luteus TaxID=1122204 RepID=A0A1H2QFH1_9BACI|nr:hypothetical protein [Marinococcus luteus]SDW05967.1 hypothetical protein SAMN05421781_0300 [Marinococcus luteus]
MSIAINFYPTINDKLINKIGLQVEDYKVSYLKGNNVDMETESIRERGKTEYIQVIDSSYEWDPVEYGLSIQRKITINNPRFLFGPAGVAPKNAVISLGIIWSCKSVKTRGAKEISQFDATNHSPITFDLKLDFDEGFLKKELKLEMVLYIKKPGELFEGEEMLGNTPGLNLGSIRETTTLLEGNGSIFPVVEVKDSGSPLWWVECSWEDPQEDLFDEENIKICINKAHQNFSLVYAKAENMLDSPLLLEIIASALQIIIQEVQHSDYWENIKKNENNSTGSIGEAVYYFLNMFNWNFTSPRLLSKTIREYLETSIEQ